MKAQIPEGKKRVGLTLTIEKVEEFQKIAKDIHMGRNFLSAFVEEQLDHGIIMMKSMKEARDKGEKIDVVKMANQVAERARGNYEKEN